MQILFWTWWNLVIGFGATWVDQPLIVEKTPKLVVVYQQSTDPDQAFINEWLKRVNDLRAKGCRCGSKTMKGNLKALSWSAQLYQSALLHAQDMDKQGYFSHTSQNGDEFWTRAEKVGYKGFPRAENIAAGQTNIESAFASWFKSAGHCENMMLEDATEIAVAQAGPYWVMMLGVAQE